jgi:autotransporter-associated beta strand protein
MRHLVLWLAVGALSLFAPATLSATVVTISDVPSYIWYNGCGPTAAGMIVGYWDAHGFPDLITAGDGTNSWVTNQQAVKDMIASPGHIHDYIGYGTGKDRVATPADPYHADNSVADFMGASRGSVLADGDSYADEHQFNGMAGYSQWRGYADAQGGIVRYAGLWSQLVTEINAGRPMELYVDSDHDGTGDHFVTAIGYDDTTGAHQYEAYNTWDQTVHWYMYSQIKSGQAFGVGLGITFSPAPDGETLTWTGKASAAWGLDYAGNWTGNGGGARGFRHGDAARFIDTAAAMVTVNLSGAVDPGSVVVDNSATDFQFTGVGGITGATGLVKRGTGRLTLATANSYVGDTEIQNGILVVGAAGALGGGSVKLGATTGADSVSLLVDAAVVVDRPITVQNDHSGTSKRILGGTNTAGTAEFSASISLQDDLTLTAAPGGTVKLTGLLDDLAGKAIAKSGAGILAIAGPQSYGPGAVLHAEEGDLYVETDMGSDAAANLTVEVGGEATLATIIFDADEHFALLHVMDGGTARLGPACHVLWLDSLVIDALGITLTDVRMENTPEPATLALLAGGLGLAYLRTRKRRPDARR